MQDYAPADGIDGVTMKQILVSSLVFVLNQRQRFTLLLSPCSTHVRIPLTKTAAEQPETFHRPEAHDNN